MVTWGGSAPKWFNGILFSQCLTTYTGAEYFSGWLRADREADVSRRPDNCFAPE